MPSIIGNIIKIELKFQFFLNTNFKAKRMLFTHIPLRLAISRVYDQTLAAEVYPMTAREKTWYTFHQIVMEIPVYGQAVPGFSFKRLPIKDILPDDAFENGTLKNADQKEIAYQNMCVKRKDLKKLLKKWKKLSNNSF